MNVRERILAIRVKEKQDKNPEYAKKIGVQIKFAKKSKENSQEGEG